MEITVDDKAPLKTETVKSNNQPNWNETFTLLVNPHSKIHFAVKDHNSFRKDTVVGEKRLDLFVLLTIYNGKCDNLDVTLDLTNESKQTDSPVKVGELLCMLKGLFVDMSRYARPSSSMPLTQANTSNDHSGRAVLNGIRARPRGQGIENAVPGASRGPNTERIAIANVPAVPIMPVLPISPSTNTLANGE